MKARLISIFVVALLTVAQAFAARVQVIIKLEPKIDHKEVNNIAKLMGGGRVLDEIPRQNLFLIEVPEKLAEHAKFLGVHSWETNKLVQKKLNAVKGFILSASTLTPQWYYSQPALTRIGRPAAMLVSTGRGVVIADINSNVDYAHPALAGALTSGYDFVLGRPYSLSPIMLNQSDVAFLDQSDVAFLDQSDVAFLDGALLATNADAATSNFLKSSGVNAVSASSLGPQVSQPAYSHGTLCAGMIHSIAPDSMIMPLRAFDDSGNTDLFTLAKAIDFAVANHAQVINLSFGLGADSDSIHTSLQAALNAGITVIASAGNDNLASDQFPASYTGVLSIAATDIADLKASFSNYSLSVDVSAPGVNVISSFPGGYYAVISGTSFAAPIVAGEAALLRAMLKDPLTAIPQNTVNIDALNVNYSGRLGTGRIDLSQAVSGPAIAPPPPPTIPPPPPPTIP
ncbi:MAG TPA: S8 family serine peptidase [Terriglobia bacterium]|nr:S8 family serine peptidase [Terriglobia bacterium]